jgi:polygalacturonase
MTSKLQTWILLICGLSGAASPAATFNVRNTGAKADKTANDAPAIQAAIDACAQSGGGEVLVPAGNYLAGKIILKSNVTLKLESGATIWQSGRIEDYNQNPKLGEHGYLLEASNAENIVIAGDGTFVGTGHEELGRRANAPKMVMPAHRFGIIHFTNCRNVRLREFTILDSEAHAVVIADSENVFADGVSILSNFFRVNTDGIDPVSCTNTFISNCHIVGGDDCICPKAEKGRAVENLVVDNCILESISAAFKLGTASSGDFRDIKVSNCVIRNSGIGLGLFIKDGGTVERVSFSNISIETTPPGMSINSGLRNTIIPIYIDLTRRHSNSPLSRVRDVSFSNIQIASDNSIVIQGMAERALENITLRDIAFRVNGAFDFSQRVKREGGKSTYRSANKTQFVRQPTYCAVAYVNGLTVDNVRVVMDEAVFKEFPRSAVAVFHSQNGIVQDVSREPSGTRGGPPAVVLTDCKSVSIVSPKP